MKRIQDEAEIKRQKRGLIVLGVVSIAFGIGCLSLAAYLIF